MSNLKESVFLEGKRINLRPPLKSDFPFFIKWMNDPGTRLGVGNRFPSTEKGEEKFLERVSESRDELALVIVSLEKDNPIGIIGLHKIDWISRTAISGTIIEKGLRGQGFGTEAKKLLLNYAFNTLNLRKISARIYEFNKKSIISCERCGYKQEATLKEEKYIEGHYYNECIFSIFKEDFIPVWENYCKKK
jgi:RimJ/RimL family protein N-acetyltransferase